MATRTSRKPRSAEQHNADAAPQPSMFGDVLAPAVNSAITNRPAKKFAPWPTRIDVAGLVSRCIADGTHAEQGHHFCAGCRQWVTAIHHVTMNKQELCIVCAIAIGGMSQSDYRSAIKWMRRELEQAKPDLALNGDGDGDGGTVWVCRLPEVRGTARYVFEPAGRFVGVSAETADELCRLASERAPPAVLLDRLRSMKAVKLTE